MGLEAIYSELILEHNQYPKNRRKLENPDVRERGHNPSCGDELMLELKFEGDTIKEACFTGVGCAISQASTSMMVDLVEGKSKLEALQAVELFLGMIKKEVSDDELDALGDAICFKNISNMPARVKCAVLAWHSLKEALTKS